MQIDLCARGVNDAMRAMRRLVHRLAVRGSVQASEFFFANGVNSRDRTQQRPVGRGSIQSV